MQGSRGALCAIKEGSRTAVYAVVEAFKGGLYAFQQIIKSIRLPDYFSLNINVAIPNPITGTLVGWSGHVVLDRFGNVYLAPTGGNVGR